MASRNGKRTAALSKTENFICGSAAGTIGFAILYPFDVVRTIYSVSLRSPISGAPPASMGQVFRDVYQKRGFRGFYGGLGAGMIGIVPFAGTRLTVGSPLLFSSINFYLISILRSTRHSNRDISPIGMLRMVQWLRSTDGRRSLPEPSPLLAVKSFPSPCTLSA